MERRGDVLFVLGWNPSVNVDVEGFATLYLTRTHRQAARQTGRHTGMQPPTENNARNASSGRLTILVRMWLALTHLLRIFRGFFEPSTPLLWACLCLKRSN